MGPPVVIFQIIRQREGKEEFCWKPLMQKIVRERSPTEIVHKKRQKYT
jgi:hypothetical protein